MEQLIGLLVQRGGQKHDKGAFKGPKGGTRGFFALKGLSAKAPFRATRGPHHHLGLLGKGIQGGDPIERRTVVAYHKRRIGVLRLHVRVETGGDVRYSRHVQ